MTKLTQKEDFLAGAVAGVFATTFTGWFIGIQESTNINLVILSGGIFIIMVICKFARYKADKKRRSEPE